jgi:hypothetical protein
VGQANDVERDANINTLFVAVEECVDAAIWQLDLLISDLLPIEWAIFRKIGVIWCSMEAPS